ncbi:phosphatidylinositol-specific phospholipase C domain-containing protein [Endozoicomonas ascidiicola]|uniref:phosphatidylinositol-specific phospholipase C domain-containing protein n=1 Tax=Endozoicomonas ascidiicola TaxID=1698521 RepID=UPI00082B15EF|nr:phosphatidylinositol-specific phospholipase C domain-containing protein [Endozoicomonas ascidiicola]
MKMDFRTISLAVITLIISFSSVAHNDEAYNHDGGPVANNPDWMSRLNGNQRLSELSLPGTNGTMVINQGTDIVQTQAMSLRDQLNSGIRVLDIRVRHKENTLKLYHQTVSLNGSFGKDVLQVIDQFLTEHPTETVVFRLKSLDHWLRPLGKNGNTRSLWKTLDADLAKYGSKRWVPTTNNPTLNEIRGSFVIIQDTKIRSLDGGYYSEYEEEPSSNGFPFGILISAINIQQNVRQDYMNTNWKLYEKWVAIKNHIDEANKSDEGRFFMNFLSSNHGPTNIGVFPYFVVSGHSSPQTSAPRLLTGLTTPGWSHMYPEFPRVSCFIGICSIAFEGTNTLTADYIAGQKGRVGMIMTDFPGKRLIENIINLNDLYLSY